MLIMGEEISAVKLYTKDDIATAVCRAAIILADRLATRGRKTITEQERKRVVDITRDLARSFRVEGQVSPAAEDLTEFLLGAFDYLPVDGLDREPKASA